MADAGMRDCRKCGETKPIDEFGVRNRSKRNPQGFRMRSCKACAVDLGAVYAQRQKEKNALGPVLSAGTKVCTGCGVDKDVSEYHRNNSQPTGLNPRCKVCIRAYQDTNRDAIRAKNLQWHMRNRDSQIARAKLWREQNHERHVASKKAHYEANRDIILAKKKAYRARPETRMKEAEYRREWTAQNRESVRRHDKKRYYLNRKLDPSYLVYKRTLVDIWRCMRMPEGSRAGRTWEKRVGFTREELTRRLKRTIPDGYMWQDYLNGDLELDHIVPRVAFNITSFDDIDYRRCWSLSNLQLLPVSVNSSKGATLKKPFQPSFVGI